MKKHSLLSVFSFFLVLNLSAQEDISFVSNDLTQEQSIEFRKAITQPEKEKIYVISEELRLVANYLSGAIEYPELSRVSNVEGQVLIQFKFDGTLHSFKILKSLNAECDQLILAKMEMYATEWNRNSKNKHNEMTVNIPIDFKMR